MTIDGEKIRQQKITTVIMLNHLFIFEKTGTISLKT